MITFQRTLNFTCKCNIIETSVTMFYYIQSNEIQENIKYNAYFKKAVFNNRENIKSCISQP